MPRGSILVVALSILALAVGSPTALAQQADPAAVVAAFDGALNAGNADAALALFTDDAVVKSSSATYTGKQQIAAWLGPNLAQHIHVDLIGSRQVNGETETHFAKVTTDATRKVGVTLEGSATSVVHTGKITSYTFAFTPESLARLQAAQAAPAQMPKTGGGGTENAGDPRLLAAAVSMVVLLVTLAVAMRRQLNGR